MEWFMLSESYTKYRNKFILNPTTDNFSPLVILQGNENRVL